jgi:DNA polymerase-3 subunit epsilon
LNSAFEFKDILKDRGYRWNSEAKVWVLDLAEADRTAEFEWLKANVYDAQSAEVDLEIIDAKRRYSGREGKKERMRLDLAHG